MTVFTSSMDDLVIGVDFDNTIADYDEMMHGLGVKEGLISTGLGANKQEIRDHIRSLENGEIKWQELQAKVYGKFMFQAKLIEGVQRFFSFCYQEGIPIFIISHKTQFAAQGKENVDLHGAALKWMQEKRFFDDGPEGLALREDQIFFEPNRQKKIERIGQLGCTHFIDDLSETFMETSFPKEVQKILYAPSVPGQMNQDVLVKSSWKEIDDYFFTNIRK